MMVKVKIMIVIMLMLIIMTELMIILITIIGSCKKLWLMLVAAQKGGGWGSNQVCGLTANQ